MRRCCVTDAGAMAAGPGECAWSRSKPSEASSRLSRGSPRPKVPTEGSFGPRLATARRRTPVVAVADIDRSTRSLPRAAVAGNKTCVAQGRRRVHRSGLIPILSFQQACESKIYSTLGQILTVKENDCSRGSTDTLFFQVVGLAWDSESTAGLCLGRAYGGFGAPIDLSRLDLY